MHDMETSDSKSENDEPLSVPKLLMNQENIPPPLKVLAECCPITSWVVTCDVGVQCNVPTAYKTTNYNVQDQRPLQAMGQHRDNPSLSDETVESDSSVNGNAMDLQGQQFFLGLIHKDPQDYLGIPKQFGWTLKYICDQSRNRISELDLIVTLLKIKQNESMTEIGDQLQISTSNLTNMFVKGLECLANYYQNLIYLPLPSQIKTQLPNAFKKRYSNLQCILHSFEIEIENSPMHQAQTWSKDKCGNTLKYLIGCTPNGFVSFVSEGYGGRVSDRDMLERSQFIDILPYNAVVMADWGFEDVKDHLMSKGVKLLSPRPGIYSGTRPTEEQIVPTKVISTLRVHIERMNEKLRRFGMLNPPTEVKSKHVRFMDQIVIIACGLINLQANDMYKP